MTRYIIVIAAVLSSAVSVWAQPDAGVRADDSGSGIWQKTILSVDIEGIHSADTFLVLNSSALVPGDIVTPGLVQDAIKGVYGLGLFSEVEIDADLEEAGVKLTIKVREYSKLNDLKFSGNRKIKTKKLKEKITLFEGRLVSPKEIKNNIERIESMYSEKGYLLVKIETEQSKVEGQEGLVDLEFKISEGVKVRVGKITFLGNHVFADKKLRSKMSTKQKRFLRSGSFDKEKYLEDKDKIIQFYKKEGYIDAVILGDSILYSDDKTRMFIEIELREGERYYFGNLSWDGNTLFSDEDFRKKVKFKEGQVFNQEKFDETLFKFHEMYQDEGYWYAQFDEESSARGDTLDFHWNITENDPVYIRLINILGNTKTHEKVIRRELLIKPKTIFKRSILGRSLREVMILNFFGDVTPDWDVLPNGDIDLKINVEEKPTGQFSVGAGYSAIDKVVATIGLGVPNLFGTGQTATMNLDIGRNRTTFDISYLEPWFLDTPTSLSGNLYLQERRWYDWFTESRIGSSVRVGRRLRWPDNYFRIFAGYRLEQVKYIDISESYRTQNVNNPYAVDKQNWPLTTSSTSLTILRDSRDLPQFPTAGSVVSWRGELGGTILGGDWNYYKQIYSAEYYRTLFWKVVAMARAKYGEIDGIYHGENDIPYTDRFAPGGVDPDGTIRGYDDGRVGPRDENGAFLRGRFELIYNFELTVAISDQQFYILLFADAGNAYRSLKDIRLFKRYYRSVGPGFRIIIPFVGIMGFDFGYAFDGFQRNQWNTHFQIGRGF